MPEFLRNWPFALALGALIVGGMLRGQMMYWIGRVVTEQTMRRTHPKAAWMRRTKEWLEAGGADPGVRALQRWGLVMVPISYLTVGFQSMVQAAAGVLRIAWWKYTLAQIPGAVVWGSIYATIGFAAWELAFKHAVASPLGTALVVLALALVVLAAVLTVRQVRRRRHAGTPSA